MELKSYQKETLAAPAHFFQEARVGGPKAAYETIVNEQLRRRGSDVMPVRIGRSKPCLWRRMFACDCRPVAARLCSQPLRSRLLAIAGSRETIRWYYGWCRPTPFACRPWKH